MKIVQIGAKVGEGQGIGKGNAGDTAIGSAFEYLFNKEFHNSSISFMNCRKNFSEEDIEIINQHDVLILSGGGLFLYDTFENDNSDWQWGISEELLSKISIPIIVYSVGYNKFRGQRDFNLDFNKTIERLVEKSVFFSLRNSGSCNAIKKHIPEELHEKIKLNFCPTMLLNEKYKISHNDSEKVGFVIAGDRLEHRHTDIEKFVEEIREFVSYLARKGKKSVLINHQNDTWIKEYDVEFDEFIDLYQADSKKIFTIYSEIDTVVCDRGHAQMIPFSLGCKILTPISHNKLKWFLRDMNLEKFGIEENDEQLCEKLIESYERLQDMDWDKMYKKKMEFVKTTYSNNMKIIKSVLVDKGIRDF